MTELAILFGLLAAVVLALTFILLRRGNRRTENADGLLVEQERRMQAQSDRITYSVGVEHYLLARRDHQRH
ncbi:hypothetical protein ACIGAN_26220 [Streptomyces sp. NPDC085931]|uniref:hypothetical protein n=1 Tax=Streptomyces sp. NPDC085931 TaxID=3365740 RepID=UPI0037D08556